MNMTARKSKERRKNRHHLRRSRQKKSAAASSDKDKPRGKLNLPRRTPDPHDSRPIKGCDSSSRMMRFVYNSFVFPSIERKEKAGALVKWQQASVAFFFGGGGDKADTEALRLRLSSPSLEDANNDLFRVGSIRNKVAESNASVQQVVI